MLSALFPREDLSSFNVSVTGSVSHGGPGLLFSTFGKIKGCLFHAFLAPLTGVITRKAGRTRRVLRPVLTDPKAGQSLLDHPQPLPPGLGLGAQPCTVLCSSRALVFISQRPIIGCLICLPVCVSLSLFLLLSASHWLFFLPGALSQGLDLACVWDAWTPSAAGGCAFLLW